MTFASWCCLSLPVPVSPMTMNRTSPVLFGSVSDSGGFEDTPRFVLADLFWALTPPSVRRIVNSSNEMMRFMNSPLSLWKRISHVVHDQSVLAIDQQQVGTNETEPYLLR